MICNNFRYLVHKNSVKILKKDSTTGGIFQIMVLWMENTNIRAPSYYEFFFNCKDVNSIVLITIFNDNYCYQYIDNGCNGRVSDGGVFKIEK